MKAKKTFYITTPIYYPNDKLHIGHAYTTVAADTMKRYKKMRGYDAYLLTGTDEHGQKIQRTALEAGKTPQEFVNTIVKGIKDLWKILQIDYDDFIRTTEERHKKITQHIFQKVYDKGDIYKAQYSGWYCAPCETFFTPRQLGENNTCPDCGRQAEITEEESYFFKMSKYAERWMAFIEENPDFIQPLSRRNEMMNFVKQGLEDLCVSRTTFDWGIKVPFDEKHVIYVWFDALVNYISALGYGDEDDSLYRKYWPCDIHLMAKDIIRFHSVIWPIILMAADIPLPKKVIAHGWLTLGESKMSKSKGNVIEPAALAEKYGLEAVRYFLMREMPFGADAVYSEDALINKINVDLANDYGNLISRTTAMIDKFQNGLVLAPAGAETAFDAGLKQAMEEIPPAVEAFMDKMDFANALAEIWALINKANKYIDDAAPWDLNKKGEKDKLASVLYNVCEIIRKATIMMSPVLPSLPFKVWAQLGIAEYGELHTWESIKEGTFPPAIKIQRGAPLFPRLDIAASEEKTASSAEEKPSLSEEIPPLEPEITMDDFAKMDLRVVKVLSCERVPKTAKLLKFRLLLGDQERTVLSGIAEHYNPEHLIGKNLILIANLKPIVIRGIESQGMLLSAVGKNSLELLEVPSMASGVKVQ
jgi:methionyl-tRNA synthetase